MTDWSTNYLTFARSHKASQDLGKVSSNNSVFSFTCILCCREGDPKVDFDMQMADAIPVLMTLLQDLFTQAGCTTAMTQALLTLH